MERKMQNVQKFVFLNQMKDIDHEIAFEIIVWLENHFILRSKLLTLYSTDIVTFDESKLFDIMSLQYNCSGDIKCFQFIYSND